MTSFPLQVINSLLGWAIICAPKNSAFDRVICGNLRRHQETAAGLGLSQSIEIDARVNELRYFDLAREYQAQTREPLPNSAEEFAQHVPQLFTAWHAGRLDNAHESYRSFADRFAQVMSELARAWVAAVW